jgi:hypothetical protein
MNLPLRFTDLIFAPTIDESGAIELGLTARG